MSKKEIEQLLKNMVIDDGIQETGIKGVKVFKVTNPIKCSPAVYEPCIVAIVSGVKEAVLDGKSYVYDSNKYLCCPMSMPVEAGVSRASKDNPLLGVYISLDTKVMRELVIEMESVSGSIGKLRNTTQIQGLTLSLWDDNFIEALFRLLQLFDNTENIAVLGEGRLKEVYYTILKGDAGMAARRAFGIGNGIARAIDYMSSNIYEAITIEAIASKFGMSRAVFHRKFKQATTMSPIQFIKSMRLNSAAMMIAEGKNVNEAAMEVGYVSTSQFSREFKRTFGQPPRQWSRNMDIPIGIT